MNIFKKWLRKLENIQLILSWSSNLSFYLSFIVVAVVWICIYFEIQVCYPPAVQVVESFQNISEIQCHLFLCQIAPAHYIVQETPLVCPENTHTVHLLLATFHRDKTCIFASNNEGPGDITVLTSLAQEHSCWPSHMCPAAWPGWDGPESAGVWSPAAPVLDAAASCWRVSPQPSVYSLSGRSA